MLPQQITILNGMGVTGQIEGKVITIRSDSLKYTVQSNLDYPDYLIIRTFFSGPTFFMNIN